MPQQWPRITKACSLKKNGSTCGFPVICVVVCPLFPVTGSEKIFFAVESESRRALASTILRAHAPREKAPGLCQSWRGGNLPPNPQAGENKKNPIKSQTPKNHPKESVSGDLWAFVWDSLCLALSSGCAFTPRPASPFSSASSLTQH